MRERAVSGRRPTTVPSGYRQATDACPTIVTGMASSYPYRYLAFTLMMVFGYSQPFSPTKLLHARHTTMQQTASSKQPNELFDSPGWAKIKEELDQVPVFSIANGDGLPIKYTINKDDTSFEIPLFYTHVSDALLELEKAMENKPLQTGMDISPYPLGDIFELWANDAAVIVPNKKSIIQAGAPPTAIAMGQQVPLFACMEIAQENESGKLVLPLFFELEDANDAVSQAVSSDGGKTEDFEVVGLNLPEAVSLLANAGEEQSFQFVPPASSLKHIRDYLSGG